MTSDRETTFAHLPPTLRALFQRYHDGTRRLKARLGLAAVVVAYGGLVLIATHLDRLLRFAPGGRLLSCVAVHALLALIGVALAARWWWRRHPSAALAYELEQRLEHDGEHLVSAFSLLDDQGDEAVGSPVMKARLERQAEEWARAVPEHPAPRDRRQPLLAACLALLAVVGALLLAIPAYQFGLMLRRFYQPLANLPHASFTRIRINDYPNPVGSGADATLAVTLGGWIPGSAQLELRPGRNGPLPMQRIGREAFLHTLHDLRESLEFRIRAGDAQTDWQPLRVVEQPSVEALTVTIQPPAYSLLESVTLERPDEVRALEGSRLELQFVCRQPLAMASLETVDDDGLETLLPLIFEAGTARWTIDKLDRSLRLRILLRNLEGFDNLDRDPWRLLCVKDRPPEIQFEGGMDVVQMFPTEERAFPVKAEDDLGLLSLGMGFVVNPNPDEPQEPRRLPLETFAPPVRTAGLEAMVSLAALRVEPGDVVEFFVEGADSGGNHGLSQRLLIQVVSFDPGLEEQRRIDFLRLLAATVRALLEAPAAAPGRIALPPEQSARLVEQAAALGVPFPELADCEAAVLLRRIAAEQDMTPFHVHAGDLRESLALIGLAVCGGLAPEARPARLAWLAASWFPAQVQYRFHRNLLRALGAFADEAGRLAGAASPAAGADQRLSQLRQSVESWATLLARFSRESDWEAASFANFEAALTAVNTAAYHLDAGQPQTARALGDALRKIMRRSEALLPELAERLAARRAEAHRHLGGELFAFLAGQGQDAGLDLRRQLAGFWHASLLQDAALAPEERLASAIILDRLAADPPAAAAPPATDGQATTFLAAAARLHRQRRLAAHLANLEANPALGEWNRKYDLEHFQREHQRHLDDRWPLPAAADPLALRQATLPAFRAAWKDWTANVPADQQVLASARAFVHAQRRLQAILEELDQLVAAFVPEDTLARRRELLLAYDGLLRRAETLLDSLRMGLTCDLHEPPPSLEWQIGWGRVLVRLQERLEHLRESSRESVAIWRAFDNRPLDAKERDLLQARLQLVVGAARGIQRLAETLQPALDGGAPIDETFFAAETRALPVAAELERQQREVALLRTALESPEAGRTAAAALLQAHPALQRALLAELLAPQVADQAEQFARLAERLDAAARDRDAAIWTDLQEASERARLAIGEWQTALGTAIEATAAGHAATLAQLAERLAALPRQAEQLAASSALVAFTLADLQPRLRRLASDFARERRGTTLLVAPRTADVELLARLAARAAFLDTASQWERAAARRLLENLCAPAPAAISAAAAFEWHAALALRLAPPMLQASRVRLVGGSGDAARQRRHWLVDEFEESLRLPLPRRHRRPTEQYYERLKGAFREYEHTR